MPLDHPTSPSTSESSAGRARKGRLVVLSGASGSGKSTLIHRVIDRNLGPIRRSISATTREPRPGESDGVDYYFLSPEQFEARRRDGQFLEWARVHDHSYATPVGPILASLDAGVCVVLVIDVQGAMEVRERVADAYLIFVQAPDPATLEQRLRARHTDDEATIALRLDNARREVAMADRYDRQIINDDLDRAVDELADILLHHGCGAENLDA